MVSDSDDRREGDRREHVNHPSHYNLHPSGVECIDIVEHFSFNCGNAVKYIWRSGLKPDSGTLLDLEKAKWYIEREIQRLTNKDTARFEPRVSKVTIE